MKIELREKRRKRMKNHAAKALKNPQFRPRVVKPREKEKPLRDILKELEEEEDMDGV
jgi:DTW domain-containing protein YfiP